ncbi:hypothetical protein M527_07130 [Sphingobium indicum IP26]|uniref:LexA repressor DNA-binding domain-containing protein n=1 Tax=Sphingobium indicum F2 TaxID=1450518 RepID=A0A8E0WSM1_9SPHN|nr:MULTISPECIES: GntR family transcriptional regulator [Sphingobium]EPR09890.1 hypothetical protein M527_07130 [Sphingobium indicum IP26]EQB05018.1 hypothetical protein L286_09645 [Sphingobium sp. HDIP04]KER36685.1 hypothetical protein AL00_09430 [Sphingobium indicum F2]
MGIIDDIPRLSPVMASRKLQVLSFIRRFYHEHGVGPSLSEIAAALGTNRSRVQDAIRKLAREGRLHRVPGQTRGVRPAETREEALRLLQTEGWTVNPDRLELVHPNALPLLDIEEIVTNSSLPPDPASAHDGRQQGAMGHGERRTGQGGERKAG